MEHAIAEMSGAGTSDAAGDIAVLREVLDDQLVYAHSNAATDTRNPTWRSAAESFAMSPSRSRNKHFAAWGRSASARPHEGAGLLNGNAADPG